jgi:tape measure domain-containing protein
MAKKLIQVVYQVNDAALLKAAGSLAANEAAAKKADEQVKKYGQDAKKAGDDASKSFLNLKNIWGGLVAVGITAFFAGLAKKAFELGVKQEQLNIAFATFLGSGERAKKLLADLNKFALVTPFTPDQVNGAAKALLAFGVQGEKIIPTLKLLGDVSAGTGKDLTEMAVIFGQIKSTGRLMGQDLLQLINAGFNPLQIISEKTGKSVKLLKEEMEKGLISFDMVEKAFKDATSAGGLFFNLMEAQSQSVGGLLSTVEGNIDEILKNLFTATSGPIKDFVNQLVEMSTAFLRLSESEEQTFTREQTEKMAASLEEFKKFAEAFDSMEEARISNEKTLNQEIDDLRDRNKELLREEDLNKELINSNNRKIAARFLEIKAVQQYFEELKKGDEAEKTKKVNAELERQALALARLKKLKLDFVKEDDIPSDVGFGIENLIGLPPEWQTKLDEVNKELNKELEDQQKTEVEINAEGLRQKLKDEEDYQKRKEAIQRQAFQMGVDLVREALMLSLESSQEGEKALTEAQIRQAKKEKELAIKRMLIDTAINSVKALGTPPVPNFGAAALALAFGLGSVNIARGIGGFKDGVIGLEGPGTGRSDSIPAYLSKGESVITADATNRSRSLLEAINDHKIDDRILSKLKVSKEGVTVISDNKEVVEELKNSRTDYYEQGYHIIKKIRKSETLTQHMRGKYHS